MQRRKVDQNKDTKIDINQNVTVTCAAELLGVFLGHVELGGQDVVVLVPRVRVHLLAVVMNNELEVVSARFDVDDENVLLLTYKTK